MSRAARTFRVLTRRADRVPEKRKVGSSTLPLTTICQPGWQPASPAFSLLRSFFRLYFSRSAGVCRGVSSCPWGTRGAAPDPDLWDFCGARRRLPAAQAVGRPRTSGSCSWGRFAARPEWLGCPARLISKVRGRDSASWVPSGTLAHPGGSRVAAKTSVLGVGHDAVVGAAGAGAAGAGAVAAEHLV